MIRRVILSCILVLAWAMIAPAAFAHDHSMSVSHHHERQAAVHEARLADHIPSYQEPSAFRSKESLFTSKASVVQSLCLDCTSDHDQNHDCECCFPGNHHYMCQPSIVMQDQRRSMPIMRLTLSWLAPDEQNPSGLERPPKI